MARLWNADVRRAQANGRVKSAYMAYVQAELNKLLEHLPATRKPLRI